MNIMKLKSLNFFNNLKDFEIGERIRKTYKYLKFFSRNRKHKGPLIPMKHWVAILEESTGKHMNILKDQETLTESPTRMEIEEIIKNLANGKASGKDGLKNEYIKYANESTIEELWKILKKVWESNEIPEAWRESLQIPIPKKKKCKDNSGL